MMLILVSATYGAIAVIVFRRFTNRSLLRRCVNHILAHAMELGLFLDSPALVFRAQRDLLRENIQLLRLVIIPSGILAVLFAILFQPMNATFGYGALPAGEPSVVTVRMDPMRTAQLEPPDGIVVETPGVRILHDHEISWRIVPQRPISGALKFRIGQRTVPTEIRYPKTNILGLSWLVWFAAVSSVSALLFRLCWKR
jgi:hypothetical protein